LLAPTCVGMGAAIIAKFEARGQGINPNTVDSEPSDGDEFTMNSVFGMLVLDCILYAILTW
jgi:ATP-binding cassette subfamily A (ABC1) protein 3